MSFVPIMVCGLVATLQQGFRFSSKDSGLAKFVIVVNLSR
jgi:hypothetical protein